MSTNIDTATAPTLVYAGFWRRLGAAIIDVITLFIPWCWIFLIAIAITALATRKSNYDPGVVKFIALLVASFVTPLLYFSLMEYSPWQATIGKLLFRLRVADVQGHRLSLSRAIARNLAKTLSTFTLGIGYLIAAFTPRKRALHDILAGSIVLYRPRS